MKIKERDLLERPVPVPSDRLGASDAPDAKDGGGPQPKGGASAHQAGLPPGSRIKTMTGSVGLAMVGVMILVGLWLLAVAFKPGLPSPGQVFAQLRTLLASPLHDKGPNDKGVFLLLGSSLRKVFTGFALAAVIGIPAGFAIGANKTIWRMMNPVIQVLRPVSPLAWFPIALVALKDAAAAGVLTIAVTALWPTLLNTAFGVGGVPQDHRNVARVFRFSKWKYLRHVLLPYSMGSIITGLRLSMGISWMVIVATEMLSGGNGIGFFVWDSYNNNNLAAVVAAIGFIGVIGFALDLVFARLAMRFDYSGAAS